MEITTRIYHSSTEEMPWQDWEQVRHHAKGGDTFMGMSPRFLACIEQSMNDISQLWYVLFYSDTGTPIASACLSTLRVDLVAIADAGTRRAIGALRKLLPSLCHLNVLFCGLPVSLGQKNLLFTPEADPKAVLAALDRLLTTIARQQKAWFIVYKEHGDEDLHDLKSLVQHGYRQAVSLDMHVFEEPFQNFEHYLSNLNSHYRYDIRRSRRKLDRAGVTISRWEDPATIRALYTEALHQRYLDVVEKSENKLEILPVDFFHELTRQFPRQVALTGLVKDGQILAFNWSLTNDASYQFMFCGIDYSANAKMDLYFNLMYSELDYALQSGAREIKVGQTASQFKTRLGCSQRPLHLFIKGVDAISRSLLALGFNLLFPPRPERQEADIYSSKYISTNRLSQKPEPESNSF